MDNGRIEEEIRGLEEELRETEARFDAAALDRVYADDIIVTAPTGVVVDKAAAMSEVRQAAEKATVETYQKDDLRVRAYGDTAVTSYRMTIKARFGDTQIDRRLRITNVWLRRQGRWQIVSRHTADIAAA